MNRSKTQSIHLHQLIEGLRRAQTGESLPRPQGGWLRAVRQATGLSLKSVAGQLNVSPQAVHQLEKSEAAATVSLKQLSAAAAAMAIQPAPFVPGHTTLRLGTGVYGGQSAIGVTARRTSDDGSWSIDGGVTTTSFGTGAQAGVSVVLP